VVKLKWKEIKRQIMNLPYKENIEVKKGAVSHPLRSGFQKHYGAPKGQFADYRKCLPDGSCIHVLEYKDKYYIHRDRFDPRGNMLGHIFYDLRNVLGFALASIIIITAGYWVYIRGKKLRET
jgi:hypothetical protein